MRKTNRLVTVLYQERHRTSVNLVDVTGRVESVYMNMSIHRGKHTAYTRVLITYGNSHTHSTHKRTNIVHKKGCGNELR
jgi:hypothetical protein